MTLREDLETLTNMGLRSDDTWTLEKVKRRLDSYFGLVPCADRNGGIYCGDIRTPLYDLDVYLADGQFKAVFTYRFATENGKPMEVKQNYLYVFSDLTSHSADQMNRLIGAIAAMSRDEGLLTILHRLGIALPEGALSTLKMWSVDPQMCVHPVVLDLNRQSLPDEKFFSTEKEAIKEAILKIDAKEELIRQKYAAKLSKWSYRKDLLRRRTESDPC